MASTLGGNGAVRVQSVHGVRVNTALCGLALLQLFNSFGFDQDMWDYSRTPRVNLSLAECRKRCAASSMCGAYSFAPIPGGFCATCASHPVFRNCSRL